MKILRSDGSPVLASLSLLLSPLAFGSSALQANRTQTFDLRPLLSRGAPPAPGVTMDLHVTTAAIDRLEPSSWNVYLDSNVDWSATDTVEAVEAVLDQVVGTGAVSVTTDGRWLSVTGSEEAIVAASQVVEKIERYLLASFDVEVFEIPIAAVPAGTSPRCSAQTTAELLASGSAAQVARVPVSLGRRRTIDQTTVRSFVQGFDIEVAQGAVNADPTVSILRKGTELGLRLDRASDGQSLILRAWGRRGEETAPLRRVPIPVFAGAEIELPSMRSSIWASSARLRSGESMLLDAGGDSVLMIRLASQPELPAYSFGAHALAPMRPEPIELPWNEPSGGWSSNRGEFETRELQGLKSIRGLMNSLGLEAASHVGPEVLCAQGSELEGRASDAIRSLDELHPVPEFTIEVSFVLQDEGDSSPVSPDAPGAVTLSATSVGGDAALLVHGIESAFLKDFDAQVAAGSVGAAPIVATRFLGNSVWCSPMTTSSGDLHAWFDVRVHREGGPTRSYAATSYHPETGAGDQSGARFFGDMRRDLPIELPSTLTAGGVVLASLKSGEWGHVLTQSFSDGTSRLTVLARITAR